MIEINITFPQHFQQMKARNKPEYLYSFATLIIDIHFGSQLSLPSAKKLISECILGLASHKTPASLA